MDRKTFDQYCESFSTTDKKETYDLYYTEDARFEHPVKGSFTVKRELVTFWNEGHKGIREVIKPVNVFIEGDRIAAEFIIEWHCFEDTEYMGPRKKGEVYYGECAAFYRLRNDRFEHVKVYARETPGGFKSGS